MKTRSNQEAVMTRVNALARSGSARWAIRSAALLFILLISSVMPSGQTPPDTFDPLVWFVSPYEDETVSGTKTIEVEAWDASGIAGVVFEVDGAAAGAEDVTEPWSFAWDTNASGAGSHIITVVVRDTAGNAVRSDVVPVVVGTYVPPPPPPPPVNHNPVAVGDSLASVGRVPVTFTAASLLANDSDPDGQVIAVTSVASTSSGGGTIANLGSGSYTYTPAATFSGVDTFGYSIADIASGTASGVVSVTVTAPAPPPPPPGGSGLVAAFGFEEASGTTALNSSNAAFNGTILQAARVAGKVGQGLSFDGLNDWVTVNDITASPLDLTTGMTIEAWVNPTAMSGWETVVLKERGAAGTGLLSYALYAHDGAPQSGGFAGPAGYLRPAPANSTTDQGVRQASHTAIPLNGWTHIATTYDGVNQRLYINGVLVATRAQTGSMAVGNQPLRIGGNNVSGEFFRGVIDEVRVYNRALSVAEIGADMITPIVP
jgi:hypothetical protein